MRVEEYTNYEKMKATSSSGISQTIHHKVTAA